MPNCFQLTLIGETEPSTLQSVDNRLWQLLGNVDPDPKRWYKNWYNIIGLALACGKNFKEIQGILEEQLNYASTEDEVDHYQDLINITWFLQDNYTTRAWYQSK